MKLSDIGAAKYISSATTTQVKATPGKLFRIIVGETAAGAIQVFDHASADSNQVAELKTSIAEGSYEFNMTMRSGIRVKTVAASKITVVYE